MKNLIIILTLLPSLAFSQRVSFITKSDSIHTTIQGYSDKAILTEAGYIDPYEIKRAFYFGEPQQYFLEKMESLDVPVFAAGADSEEIAQFAQLQQMEEEQAVVENADLEERIENFRRNRDTGYTLQTIGTGVTVAGAAAESAEVIIAGSAISFVGFIVSWSAGNSLKKKKKSQ